MSKQSLPDEQIKNTKVELVYQGMTNAFGKVRMTEQWGKCTNIDDVKKEDENDSSRD